MSNFERGAFRGRGRGGDWGSRGRGGGDWGSRGRGGGASRGGFNKNQEREKNAIREFMDSKTFNCQMSAHTNLYPLNVDTKKVIYRYTVSYEMKDGAKDLQDRMKEKACGEMLRSMQKKTADQCDLDFALCVCTGQHILSPKKLPDEKFAYDFTVAGRGGKKVNRYTLTLNKPDTVVFDAENNRMEINSVIGKAVQICFPEKLGTKYVDLRSGKTATGGKIVTFDCLIPKVFVTTLGGKQATVLQIDVAVSVATAQNCLDVYEELKKFPRGFDRRALERFVNKKVCTMFKGYKGAVYKIIEIVTTKKAGDSAGLKKNPKQTYVEYFKERYGSHINPDQILFECRHSTGKKVLIPPEVLYELSVSENDRRQLPLLCSLYPNDRAERIEQAVKRLRTEEGGKAMEFLKAYGISFQKERIKIKGRVLQPVDVLIPGGAGHKLVQTLGESSQQGFIKELKDLRHPGNPSKRDVIVYDETRNGERVLGKISTYLLSMNAGDQLGSIKVIKEIKKAKELLDKDKLAFAFFERHDKDKYRELKGAWTNKGAVSQVIVKDLTNNRDAPILMAVSQQVCAKGGRLNWVVDINKLCPSLQKKGKASGILIIGADFGRDLREIRSEVATSTQDVYTVAFVAFFVHDAEWLPYSNHYHLSGRKQVVFGQTSDTESSLNEEMPLPSEVLSEKLKDFYGEAKRHFADKGLQPNAVLVFRGCASEGEVLMAKRHDADLFAGMLPDNVEWAVVAAQRYQHTRFSADAPQPSDGRALCNVPRGFVTDEGTDKKFGESFFLSGANCTLGHARATLYVVLGRTQRLDIKELQALIYGLCFLYPNKTDALPIPLPLKCASEYARKFVVLQSVQRLQKELRTKLHFL